MDTPCIEAVGSHVTGGYISVWVRAEQRLKLAHRKAWEDTHGAIPLGLYVCHHCDNPPCCNPEHLFLGTPQQNMDDAKAKGRVKPHETCKRGHAEWATKPNGQRRCRACCRESMRRRRVKKRTDAGR